MKELASGSTVSLEIMEHESWNKYKLRYSKLLHTSHVLNEVEINRAKLI